MKPINCEKKKNADLYFAVSVLRLDFETEANGEREKKVVKSIKIPSW